MYSRVIYDGTVIGCTIVKYCTVHCAVHKWEKFWIIFLYQIFKSWAEKFCRFFLKQKIAKVHIFEQMQYAKI